MALLLLSLLFLFTACGGQPKPVDRFTGTQGLVIEFAENAPPETVFEGTAFPVRVLVRDAGATDIPYDRMLLTFSTDPLYLSGGISPYFPARHDPDSIAERRTGIQGKSAGYPDGELLAFTMPLDSAFSANPVVGQRESPETRILAGVCYAYTTYYAASICVDTNAYAENLRDQPCQTEELSPTGGQGAPVAVTGVKVQALPVVDRTLGLQVTRPYVTLTIENVGTGQVVGPDTLDLASACLLRDIPKEELGTVRVSASLLNSALECQPEGLVRLVDGKGEIRCTVPESELGEEQYAATQNYVTTLVVNLTYLYKSSTETTVKIERTSLNGEDGTFLGGRMTGYEYIRAGATPPQAVLPGLSEPVQLSTIGKVVTDAAGLEWQMLGTSEGQPVSSCDLYANNPDLIPSELGLVSSAITPAWSCACGQTRCVTLSRTGRCLAGLCPAGTYCCTDQKVVPPPGEEVVPETGTIAEVVTVSSEISQVSATATKQEINDLLNTMASQYGIPADILKAIAYKESQWNPGAVGDGGKSYGMMQIYTSAHPDYDVARGKTNIAYNVEYGASFLASHYRSTGDWRSAVTRYNGSGPAARAYADSVLQIAQQRPWMRWGVA